VSDWLWGLAAAVGLLAVAAVAVVMRPRPVRVVEPVHDDDAERVLIAAIDEELKADQAELVEALAMNDPDERLDRVSALYLRQRTR